MNRNDPKFLYNGISFCIKIKCNFVTSLLAIQPSIRFLSFYHSFLVPLQTHKLKSIKKTTTIKIICNANCNVNDVWQQRSIVLIFNCIIMITYNLKQNIACDAPVQTSLECNELIENRLVLYKFMSTGWIG